MTIVIVGAGVIGVSIADALARRGASVTVIDMRAPGRGASHASAGVLAPYIEAHEDSPLLRLAVRSLERWDDFVAGVRDRSGREIEYARTGTLEVALDDAEAAHLQKGSRSLTDRHVEHEWLESAAVRSFEPSLGTYATAGRFIKSHGIVGVASLMTAVVHSARLAGAAFEQPVEAVRIDPGPDRVDVKAGDRSYPCDHVVVAAGSWSSQVRVTGASVPRVTPIRGQLVHLAWSGSLPKRSVWGTSCYTVPWSDGSLLVGATVEDVGFDERSTLTGVEGLMTAARRLLPAAARSAVEGVRVGLRPATPDGLPYIGPLAAAPRVILATGHYRNGVLLAPLTADLVSGLLLDQAADPALEITAPSRVNAA